MSYSSLTSLLCSELAGAVGSAVLEPYDDRLPTVYPVVCVFPYAESTGALLDTATDVRTYQLAVRIYDDVTTVAPADSEARMINLADSILAALDGSAALHSAGSVGALSTEWDWRGEEATSVIRRCTIRVPVRLPITLA